MKKGIIAVSLLLSGALLITPITNALSKSDEKETTVKPVKSPVPPSCISRPHLRGPDDPSESRLRVKGS